MDNSQALQQTVRDASAFIQEWASVRGIVPEAQKAISDVAHLLYYSAEWPDEFTPEHNFISIQTCLRAIYQLGCAYGE